VFLHQPKHRPTRHTAALSMLWRRGHGRDGRSGEGLLFVAVSQYACIVSYSSDHWLVPCPVRNVTLVEVDRHEDANWEPKLNKMPLERVMQCQSYVDAKCLRAGMMCGVTILSPTMDLRSSSVLRANARYSSLCKTRAGLIDLSFDAREETRRLRHR